VGLNENLSAGISSMAAGRFFACRSMIVFTASVTGFEDCCASAKLALNNRHAQQKAFIDSPLFRSINVVSEEEQTGKIKPATVAAGKREWREC